MPKELIESAKKGLQLSYTEVNSVGDYMAKIIAGWTALFAGLSLGDLATLAALIYTLLNIAFLLYDRLLKWRFARVTVTTSTEQGD